MASVFLLYRSILPYMETGIVEYLPSLVAGMGSAAISFQLITIGILLQRSATIRQEVRRSIYLTSR